MAITCKEIDDYLEYVKAHPKWINKDRKLLIRNIVKPTLKRDDVYLDEETFRNCLRYIEGNFYPLFSVPEIHHCPCVYLRDGG